MIIKPALTIGLILLACLSSCRAEQINFSKQQLDNSDLEKIANAIYRVEGGGGTKHPYGILSVKTSNPRQVCINTIQNNFRRWNHNSKISYLEYLSNIYCPTKGKNLSPMEIKCNKYWLTNLKKILANTNEKTK